MSSDQANMLIDEVSNFVKLIQGFYFSQYVFHDSIEAWLECSHLKRFPIIDEFLMQHAMDRKLCEESIFSIISIISNSIILFNTIFVCYWRIKVT
jgi:hypothetical protein